MNPFRSNVGTLNEILFEGKNKSYGAYAIRTAYGSTVFKSLGLTASIMLGGVWFLSALLGKPVEPVIPKVDDGKNLITYTVTLDDPKKIEKPTIEQPKSAAAAAARNNVLAQVIRDNALVDSARVNLNNLSNTTGTSSVVSTETTVTTNTVISVPTNTLSIGGGEPVTFFDEPPSFPGLKKFWNDNLKYPEAARENSVEGKVAINFVLDEEGKVISCKVIKKLGFGCDDEVLRVVKLMPNWKPGKTGGKAVKVTFNQIVDFKLR